MKTEREIFKQAYLNLRTADSIPFPDAVFDEFDLQDLCSLLKEPIKNVSSCVSKGQLKTLCKQLLVENVALRKMIIK